MSPEELKFEKGSVLAREILRDFYNFKNDREKLPDGFAIQELASGGIQIILPKNVEALRQRIEQLNSWKEKIKGASDFSGEERAKAALAEIEVLMDQCQEKIEQIEDENLIGSNKEN